MLEQLIAPILTILVSFALKKFFELIKVEIDEKVFNSIVAGIVLWFLALLGTQLTVQGIHALR